MDFGRKKVDYLRVEVTERCTLDNIVCQKPFLWKKKKKKAKKENLFLLWRFI